MFYLLIISILLLLEYSLIHLYLAILVLLGRILLILVGLRIPI
jgi:hypothetical protein